MSSEWPFVKLGELTFNLDTKRKPVKEADRKPGPYPYYGASGIVDHVDDYIFDGEHLLIAEDGENLRTRQTPIAFRACGKFWVNNHAHIVVGNERATTRYLEYAVLSSDITSYLTGAVMPKLTQGNLNRIEVPCPPRHVQDAIVGVLGSLDDRITLLRETNATLEATAQALFKSWFVDFDPVRAKMEGRAPEGMDEATAALFPDSLEETALGVVPRGWRESNFGEFVELIKGCSYKGEGLANADGAYMFNLGCFNAHRVFASEKVKRYTGEYRSRHAVQAGDLIIANTDMTQARDILGRPAFVPKGFIPGFISHHVYKASVRPEWQEKAQAIRNFLFFALQENGFRQRAIGFATGTTVLALPATAVLESRALIPTTYLFDVFDGVVQPIFETISINEQRIATLAETRDTLLPRLISGQLRVADAPTTVEKNFA
jgi:type I restriction enzyme, S subunit